MNMYTTHGRPIIALLMLISLFLSVDRTARAEGYPGFGLNTSRVVLMADDRRSGAAVALNNADKTYLVQSRVYPADGATGWPLTTAVAGAAKPAVPFLVTPPLQRMAGWSRMPLRILVTPDNHLPTDRESLFFLSAKAIPSQEAPAGAKAKGKGDGPGDAPVAAKGPRVSMAIQQFVKLYYRPAGLEPRAIFDGKVAQLLSVSRVDNRLQVSNPTPYYITFIVLKVGGKAVDAKAMRAMVPPKGVQRYPLPAGVTAGQVEWQIVDEFGLATKTERRALN